MSSGSTSTSSPPLCSMRSGSGHTRRTSPGSHEVWAGSSPKRRRLLGRSDIGQLLWPRTRDGSLGVSVVENGRVSVETIDVGLGGDRFLKADLYRPPEPNGAGIVLVHGGSFIQGDRSQLRGYGIQMGRLGYTSLACEYRLAPDHKWPAQLDDVHTALGR